MSARTYADLIDDALADGRELVRVEREGAVVFVTMDDPESLPVRRRGPGHRDHRQALRGRRERRGRGRGAGVRPRERPDPRLRPRAARHRVRPHRPRARGGRELAPHPQARVPQDARAVPLRPRGARRGGMGAWPGERGGPARRAARARALVVRAGRGASAARLPDEQAAPAAGRRHDLGAGPDDGGVRGTRLLHHGGSSRGRGRGAGAPMRQLTYAGPGELEWRDVPEPRLEGPGEAIVRPLAVSTCDLDGPIVRGETPFPAPIAMGHEPVGEVTEIGDEVMSVAVGDHVVVPFQISCGACDACRAGHSGNCTAVRQLAMYGLGAAGGDWDGALSDFLRVPYADAMLLPLPAGLEPAAAAG